jgi:hypothetical protein
MGCLTGAERHPRGVWKRECVCANRMKDLAGGGRGIAMWMTALPAALGIGECLRPRCPSAVCGL